MGLLTPVGMLQGGRSRGKTSPRGSLTLERGPGLEGKFWWWCCRVRKKPVTLSADGSALPTLCHRPDVQGQTALCRRRRRPWECCGRELTHRSPQQERRRACSTRASLRAGGTDSQQAQAKAWPLAGNPPGHPAPAQQGCPCWVLAPQPGEGGLVSAFLQACDEMMPKQHVAWDCPVPLPQAGRGCWMNSVSAWKKRV